MKDKLVIFLGGLVLGLLVGFYLTSFNDVFPEGQTVGERTPDNEGDKYKDTTFTFLAMSKEAINMSFEVECKKVDEWKIKALVHEVAQSNPTLFFYNSLTKGDINESVPLPNASIKSMQFELVFMEMVDKMEKEKLNGTEVQATQLKSPNTPLILEKLKGEVNKLKILEGASTIPDSLK